MSELNFTAGRIATLACLLEVAAPKPGNVHRGADFEDATFEDFLASSVVLGQQIDEFSSEPLGDTVRAAVERTRIVTATNTNLGMILLIVPLAKAIRRGERLDRDSVKKYLQSATPEDSTQIFAAIRAAKPGGLGTVPELDVADRSAAGCDLLGAMRHAAERDLVARQYTNGFAEVFDVGVPLLQEGQARLPTLRQSIVYAHVSLMARFPDSLIARKCGNDTALYAQMLAAKALEQLANEKTAGTADESLESFWSSIGELDFWLRSDGHRRNPGTTADLVAASLFVAIHNGILKPPFK